MKQNKSPKQPKIRLCKSCGKELYPYSIGSKCYKCTSKQKKEKEKLAKKKAIEKKKVSASRLSKKLDILFSLYIRKRDEGRPCITCGKPWQSNFQCGHFMIRRHRQTRWDEKNAHGQCKTCNEFLGGRQKEHGYAIDSLYGEGESESLRIKAQSIEKVLSTDIEKMILFFEELLKKLYEKN